MSEPPLLPEPVMHRRHNLAFAAALGLGAMFVLVTLWSVLRGTDTSYNYPDCSSLNNSDTGTKAYFEALARLGFAPSRNFKMLRKLTGARAAIFYAGPDLWSFRYSDEKDLEQFEQLASGGARVILALDPEGITELPREKPKRASDSKDSRSREDNLKKHWGIELTYVERAVASENRKLLAGLEVQPVTWRFSSWPAAWKPSHPRNGSPLFLEREFGTGSVVLIANSKLFTNRELLVHPDVDVLATAPGAYRDIIFDENHLGIADTGTVMGLATAHGLEWMLVGFVVLAILYVWRSSVSFIPRLSAPVEASVSGRDAHLALSHLLMQSVPSKSLLRVAGEEWNRSAALQARARVRPLSQDELGRLEQLRPADAAAEYRAIAARLNSK
ncbi:MAG TPA: hypothetical protein VMF91_14330 [Bryobacteraceae bacterium]|nr:hypothetical protein [Bryobacteraceae bacterium]